MSKITFLFEDWPMMVAWLTGIALLLSSFAVIGGLPWYFVAGMVGLFAMLYVVNGYLMTKRKRRIELRPDERTARNATRAARNGYLVALVAVGAIALASAWLYVSGMDPRQMVMVCMAILVLLTLVYSLSYAYYTDRDLT